MCPGDDIGSMVDRDDARKRLSRRAHDRIVGPETAAEKAEEDIFREALREGRIISSFRTKIDIRK